MLCVSATSILFVWKDVVFQIHSDDILHVQKYSTIPLILQFNRKEEKKIKNPKQTLGAVHVGP